MNNVLIYDLGADGLGSLTLSDPADLLLASGDILRFEVLDTDSDGIDELYGYLNNSNDAVLSLTPGNDETPEDGSYTLTLDGLLDLTQINTFDVGNILAGSPSEYLIISDASANENPISVKASSQGNDVNSNTGELGVNNTILNSASGKSPDETITLEFASVLEEVDGAITGQISEYATLNNVQITGVNVGSGTDSFSWTAYKFDDDGVLQEVGTGNTSLANVTNPDDSTTYISGEISVDGGYNILEITTTDGDFKLSGFTYTQDGDSIDAIFNVDYAAQDSDGDVSAGTINVSIGDNLNSVLTPSTDTPDV